MALPTIVFNAGTGSNTAASGAGPGTAITGTAAAHTGGASTNVITLTNTPDLSGVATDGSAVLWMATAAGRRFSKITAVDNGADTVTVEDAFNIAAVSAVNYAIGGKRQTYSHADTNQLLNQDIKAGWTVHLEPGTDYTLTANGPLISVSGDDTNGWITIKGTEGNRAVISTATNSIGLVRLGATRVKLQHLEIKSTAGTPGFGIEAVNTVANVVWVDDCLIYGHQDGLALDHSAHWSWTRSKISRTEIRDNTRYGIYSGGGLVLEGCWIHDNGSRGIYQNVMTDANAADWLFYKTRVTYNGAEGYYHNRDGTSIQFHIIQSVFAFNVGSGIRLQDDGTSHRRIVHTTNSVFFGNGSGGTGYGIQGENTRGPITGFKNAFGDNDDGDYLGYDPLSDDIALTVDPFVDAANGDFRLNDDAGGGAELLDAGFPGELFGFDDFTDVGAVEMGQGEGEPGGGGGVNLSRVHTGH